jgi:hypothetical protein
MLGIAGGGCTSPWEAWRKGESEEHKARVRWRRRKQSLLVAHRWGEGVQGARDKASGV